MRETPTRNPPPLSLMSRKRPAWSSSSHQARTRRFCSSGGMPRNGSKRSVTQAASPSVEVDAGGGSTWATVSAKSPTAW